MDVSSDVPRGEDYVVENSPACRLWMTVHEGEDCDYMDRYNPVYLALEDPP